MPNHRFAPGEWIGSVAADSGNRSWNTIWKHARNAGLHARRDPNLLVPGDSIWVPPVNVKSESSSTATTNKLVLTSPQDKLVIRFTRITRYIANFGPIKYTLVVGSARHSGTLNADGDQIEVPLPLDITEAKLTINGGSATLKIGSLTPRSRLEGMQARMTNLGWDVGPTDNLYGPRTRRGTKAFQAFYKISVDGVIGNQTRSKAKEVYGC